MPTAHETRTNVHATAEHFHRTCTSKYHVVSAKRCLPTAGRTSWGTRMSEKNTSRRPSSGATTSTAGSAEAGACLGTPGADMDCGGYTHNWPPSASLHSGLRYKMAVTRLPLRLGLSTCRTYLGSATAHVQQGNRITCLGWQRHQSRGMTLTTQHTHRAPWPG